MKARLHGPNNKPVVAVVGAWDPFVSAHRGLLNQLSRYATRTSLTPLAIILHPHPASYLHGAEEWPDYDDISSREALMASCGVSATLPIQFSREDLDAGAEDLFQVLEKHVVLQELWLGAHQSLGSGPTGSHDTISALTKSRGIVLKRLRQSRALANGGTARALLKKGLLSEASKIVGHAPLRRRPSSGMLHLAWPPGKYHASPIDHPLAVRSANSLEVWLGSSRPGAVPAVAWPDSSVEWLTFVAGPADI